MNSANVLIRLTFGLVLAAVLGSASLSAIAAAGDGKVTIGVALPQVTLGQGSDAAEPLRQALMNRLRSPNVDLVELSGSTPAEIEADARGKGCSQVLYTNVGRKQSIGGFLSKLAPVASMLPGLAGAAAGGGGGGGGVAGLLTQGAASMATRAATSSVQSQMTSAQQQMAAGQQSVPAQAQGLQASALATIKRGDNISFDYRLAAIGGSAPLKSETLHAKADADGQDVLSPLVEQLAQGVSSSAQSGTASAQAAPAASAADAGKSDHSGFLKGLFGSHDKPAAKPAMGAATSAGPTPDCAQIASMPNTPMTFEACQKMVSAQQAYDRAAADPSASRPGDEQMSCDQIKAELSQQQVKALDKTHVADTTAAVTKEQSMLKKHVAEANVVMAEEQVKVDAAVAVDQATGMATGGLVNPNTASAAAMAAQARIKELGARQAAERKPTEQKMYGGVADLGMDAAQQLSSNPRLARLMQLAQSHSCKGS